MGPSSTIHNIRTIAEEDFPKIWTLWQTIFPTWPISQERLYPLLYSLPGLHYIHDSGFCLSQMAGENDGKIVALGVLPEYRGKGLGTALLEKAKLGLEEAAGGELKSLKLGSMTPRFWAQMPVEFPQEVKDFFVHRGMI
jgi:beta-N-acetylhexosaminidase